MTKRKRRRSGIAKSKYDDMPEPIPDTPENVAKAILSTPPKKADEWEYLKEKPVSK